MTVRTTKLLLWASAALLLSGAIAAVAGALSMAQRIRTVQIPSSMPTHAIELRSEDLPRLEELQTLCQRDLRQSLYDPPPQIIPAALVQVEAPPPFTLVGTILEPGHSQAILLQSDGKLHFRKIGETADGARVTAISHDSITIEYHGREITLKVEKRALQ